MYHSGDAAAEVLLAELFFVGFGVAVQLFRVHGEEVRVHLVELRLGKMLLLLLGSVVTDLFLLGVSRLKT